MGSIEMVISFVHACAEFKNFIKCEESKGMLYMFVLQSFGCESHAFCM